jgi:hypothetical protein
MSRGQIIGSGIYADLEAQVDPTHRALRTSLRPHEVGVYGSYSMAAQSGVMAAGLAAASPIFEFRWSAPGVWALVKRVGFSAVNDGAAFAATSTSCFFDLIRATAFTVTDATGSNNIVFSGKTGVRSTRMAPSQIQQTTTSNIVIANTGILSAGTKTLDGSALSELTGTGLGAGTAIVAPGGHLWNPVETGKQPLELALNEGLVIRATVAATGTWRFAVEVDWDEIDPARYFGFAS